MKSIPSFFSHLECSSCRTVHDHTVLQTVCTRCGRSLLAKYDLKSAQRKFTRDQLQSGEGTLWRYRELLPVLFEENVVSLGEGQTPIFRLKRLGSALGIQNLWLKDDSFNATGSFKARGLSVAVSKARELGAKELCIPTAGNAGSALAAYAAAAGLRSHIYMPDDTPQTNVVECRLYGADVHLVRGLISDAATAMNREKDAGWFDVSTMKEPYRLEGKKTLGYEIAVQFSWRLPDVIIYPTGGGTGLIGMWKAFGELGELGWLDKRRPKMVAVQTTGCAPVVRAFEAHAGTSEFWNGASTIATGLRVPKAFADNLILDALYDSEGAAVAVSDDDILATISKVAALEGLLLSPEGAATAAALPTMLESGVISPSSVILLCNTGSGLKYAEVLQRSAGLEQ